MSYVMTDNGYFSAQDTCLTYFKENTQSDSLKNCNDFEQLCDRIKEFDKCKLKDNAQNTVIFDGTPDADIMLVGEAPGASEDKQGIPFCGMSGKLLDEIMKSIGLSRKENLFITNTVFWRPPDNRKPTPEEIKLCRPFVEKIISLIAPKLIILVGSTAAESLLDIKNIPMSKLRCKHFDYNNQYLQNKIDCTVVLHPSYILRQPSKKKDMRSDILKIAQNYEIVS